MYLSSGHICVGWQSLTIFSVVLEFLAIVGAPSGSLRDFRSFTLSVIFGSGEKDITKWARVGFFWGGARDISLNAAQ